MAHSSLPSQQSGGEQKDGSSRIRLEKLIMFGTQRGLRQVILKNQGPGGGPLVAADTAIWRGAERWWLMNGFGKKMMTKKSKGNTGVNRHGRFGSVCRRSGDLNQAGGKKG